MFTLFLFCVLDLVILDISSVIFVQVNLNETEKAEIKIHLRFLKNYFNSSLFYFSKICWNKINFYWNINDFFFT